MIKPGEPWGSPTTADPDLEFAGPDAALARAVTAAAGALVRFWPDRTSDLARAIGVAPGLPSVPGGTELPVDAIRLTGGAEHRLACNMSVLGPPPDRLGWSAPSAALEVVVNGEPWFSGRATTVVIATGQFLRGHDLVPRGHPGDGRIEVQVYALERRERRGMRARLATGAHLPHPRISSRTGRRVEVRSSRELALEIDGEAAPPVTELTAEVVPAAYRLLI